MFGIKLGLEQTGTLFERSGASGKLRYLHIAGTNGKGSTGAMLEAGLRHCGFRTGFYSSPHLADVRERFRVDGRAVSDEVLAGAYLRVNEAAESMRKEGAEPTFFEVTTAMAALIFEDAGCDFVVWETGMGGRLDATSVVTPEAAVITNIALDHQKYLGDTLAAIAGEKAGILSPGRPLFTGILAPEAKQVILSKAAELGCPVTEVREEDVPDGVTYGRNERGIYQEFRSGGTRVRLYLIGKMQRKNFVLAAAVLRFLAGKYGFPEERALKGAALAKWPARCQAVNRRLVVDGGHNPDGAQALREALCEAYPGEKFTLVFAGFRDKDVAENLRILAPLAKKWFFAPIRDSRPSCSGEELAAMAHEAGSDAPAELAACGADAVRLALQEEGLVLSAGSLYLAGEVLAQFAPETLDDLV